MAINHKIDSSVKAINKRRAVINVEFYFHLNVYTGVDGWVLWTCRINGQATLQIVGREREIERDRPRINYTRRSLKDTTGACYPPTYHTPQTRAATYKNIMHFFINFGQNMKFYKSLYVYYEPQYFHKKNRLIFFIR